MYITSFVHREELFEITRRWLCGRPEPYDGCRITEVLICDGFVVGEALDEMARLLIGMIHGGPFRTQRIQYKGELRDVICRGAEEASGRVAELIQRYRENPDFFYKDAPINGALCLDEEGRLLGLYRIKRPRRIAEKANRYIANWIFNMVQDRARRLAEERARRLHIPLEMLLTPKEDMAREFISAEEAITQGFRDGTIELDRKALSIHDVGGIKIVAEEDLLSRLEGILADHPTLKVVEREEYRGDYRARSLVIEVPWDRGGISRRYAESEAWRRYVGRGIPEEEMRKGLDRWLEGARPTLNMEVILSTFPDMVESELGSCIHEERIIAQRDSKVYKGYIPMNVEFLIEYLFSVGLSPQACVESVPIKLWGRYLPDTVISHIRRLYNVPENGPLY